METYKQPKRQDEAEIIVAANKAKDRIKECLRYLDSTDKGTIYPKPKIYLSGGRKEEPVTQIILEGCIDVDDLLEMYRILKGRDKQSIPCYNTCQYNRGEVCFESNPKPCDHVIQ